MHRIERTLAKGKTAMHCIAGSSIPAMHCIALNLAKEMSSYRVVLDLPAQAASENPAQACAQMGAENHRRSTLVQ